MTHHAAKTTACAFLLGATILPAFAQSPAPPHMHAPLRFHDPAKSALPTDPYLIGTQAALTGAYPVIGGNADGSDLWPCVNYGGKNPDCPRVGKPAVKLPGYGLVTGFPAYSWYLRNTPGHYSGIGCDGLVNGSGPLGIPYKPCAQITTWYEDATNDYTDDLVWHVTVTQGANVIYDSGLQDYGPAGPSVKYPVEVVLWADANFGYWPGASYGPNNGDCGANFFYPLQSPAFPSHYYQVAQGQTCVEPTAGAAHVATETFLGTPVYTQVTGNACTSQNVPSPCYTVTWTKQYDIHQDFDILLK